MVARPVFSSAFLLLFFVFFALATLAKAQLHHQRFLGGKGIPEEAKASESVMRNQRTLGTKIERTLRWNSRSATAKQICARNRHGAEWSGLLNRSDKFIEELNAEMDGGGGHVTFYDSALHRRVFEVFNRPLSQFLEESVKHGWPSFRAEDVVWENVRILDDGEVVTKDGLHLGHNIPDEKGPRFCINLVCVSGFAPER